MADFPLGGTGKNFDSKRSRETLVNLLAEGTNEGAYRSVRRVEGLTEYINVPAGAIRSNMLPNANFVYFVAGSRLYRVSTDLAIEDLGIIGGAGRASLEQNSAPDGNQICVLNGAGQGYIFTVGGVLEQIIDPDFFTTTSVTILNERFWFTRDGTNEFFGSEISNGLAYNPLTFATAEESPDNVVNIIAKKSALWVVGERTTQYYQSTTDTTLPLRSVFGATKERGIIAKDSLSEVSDFFAFLADDGTVRLVTGTDMQKISTLELELRIKGNGTLTYPGFDDVRNAIGFFIDGPIHKIYVLTFPSNNYTWCYDLRTGFTHERASEGLNTYRIGSSTIFDQQIIGGDIFTGMLWVIDPNQRTEGTTLQRTTLRTPSITHDRNLTIPLIELDMEVGQVNDPSLEPRLIVRYSKDGGNTFVTKEPISLGKKGNYRKRVPLRNFGRLVRNKDFVLELETTDAVGVQYYGAYWYPEVSM